MPRISYFTALGQPSFDEEVPQGLPELENPLGAIEPTHTVIKQLYMQRATCYHRPPENARCPQTIFSGVAYFCEDTARVPVGVADLVTWTRTWATKPVSIVDYDQISIQMPARGAVFRYDIGSAGAPFNWYPYLAARGYSRSMRAAILRDFFLIGTGGDYADPSLIPALNETIYGGKDVTGVGSGPLNDAQYVGIAAQNVGLFSGAVMDPGGSTSGSGNATYTASNPASGNYYIGQSRPSRFIGNIWERVATRITL